MNQRKPRLNLTGRKFGRLKVVAFHSFASDGRSLWLCHCECGTLKVIRSNNIQSGQVSCGCVNPGNTKHGMKGTPEYLSWRSMIGRCHNKSDPAYARYGGAGIKVCRAWKESFESFYNDMGARPKGTTLDRKNGLLGYFKENCRWATKLVQSRNRTSSLRIMYKNRVWCGSELSEHLNMNRQTFYWRIHRNRIPEACVV